ncbi:LamG-like jellyroll fold domain-containing protein [Flexithrix dorotheae]|uniref:LamG-like jellyroll fold domain-containing protein n=1 Tax=Flexithrix dorotheae TaxID=70993 RepID=UPI00036DFBE3|nr:LamG-like jellyroll fold domain-containing protein [Flexithrix dorotheae]
MKYRISLLLLFLIGIFQLALAQNPVVYLPLDNNLEDASGNSLHAQDAGTESTVFVEDTERGKVASFPLAAHAQLPLDDKLAFGTGDFSFAFWIKIDPNIPIPSDPVIFSNKDWGSGGNVGWLVALDGADDPTSHQWTVNVADGTSRLDWDADDNDTPGLKDGKWHFVAVTFDRDATMNVYLDGELKQMDPADDSKNLTLTPGTLDSGLPFTIMQDGTGAYSADFAALLDDILVYDRLLSDAEVLDLNNNGFTAEEDASFGASFYLPLDDNLNDASGNNLNATDAGTESTTFVDDSERGKVASFSAPAHAQLPLDDKIAIGTEDFSFAFWVKIDANIPIPSDPVILSNKDWGSGGNTGFLVALDGADDPTSHQWTVNVADGNGRLDWDADDNATPGLKDGNWHFVAVTFDRDSTMNVYFDGELKQTDPADDSKDLTLIPGTLDSGLPITIMQDGTGAYGADFAALMDDLRMWKGKVLTNEEIMAVFNFEPDNGGREDDITYGAQVYLPLDENLNDLSVNKLNATDAGTVKVSFGEDTERGLVGFFDLEAHATLPLSPKLAIGKKDFSVAFWVKINADVPVPSDPVILSNKDWGSGGNPGFLVALDGADDPTSHQWTVNVADGTSRLDWDADDNSTPGLKDGKWHFVAVTFDRDSTMNVYFDGELKQSDPAEDSKNLSLLTGELDSGLPITIMQDGTGAYGADFAAMLDDIRIWVGEAISPKDVLAIYNPNDKSYEADVFLPLNENLNDISGNGLHGTDKGSEPTQFVVDDTRGLVAEFPVAAHAQLPLDQQLNFGAEDFSVGFWVRIDPNAPIPGDPVIIGNKDWGSGGNAGFLVALDGADDPSSHLWTVNAADGAGSRLDWDADDNETPGLKDGNWHFVLVAFDRDETMNVYFDGELKQSDPADDSKNLGLIPGNLHADLPFTIMQDATGGYGDDFAARLDNIRIWNRVVNAGEVANIFENDKGNTTNGGDDGGIILGFEEEPQPLQLVAYPNPFQSETRLTYKLEKAGPVKLSIYNTAGQEIKNLVEKNQLPGDYTYTWNASGFNPGLYIFRLETSSQLITGKLLLSTNGN